MNGRIAGLVLLVTWLALAGFGAPGDTTADLELASSPPLIAGPTEDVGPGPPTWSSAVGGEDYFYCCLGQTLKVIGLFTGNVALVVAGAVGGGIACGLGA